MESHLILSKIVTFRSEGEVEKQQFILLPHWSSGLFVQFVLLLSVQAPLC